MAVTTPGAPDPLLSLVIATLGEAQTLAGCLASLAEQREAPPFEVIVVDQNGDDRLDAMVQGYSGRLDITHERVAFRAASRARNHGARLARGRWLGFPDDDCRLLPDALQQVARSTAEPGVRVVTGQTIDHDGRPNVLRWAAEPVRFTRWTMFGCLTEATLFVDRDAFLAAGGFDERFGPGGRYPAAEGIELMNRLFRRLGTGQALYNPAIRMRHPTKIPPWNRWAVHRLRSYAVGDGALIAKNPEPHILYWGVRTIGASVLQALACDGWRSIAFAARLLGLFRGMGAFTLARLTWRA